MLTIGDTPFQTNFCFAHVVLLPPQLFSISFQPNHSFVQITLAKEFFWLSQINNTIIMRDYYIFHFEYVCSSPIVDLVLINLPSNS